MLSARTVFEEIIDNDEVFRLFCSIAASIGLAHGRLRHDQTLTDADIITCLARSQVTKQRATKQRASRQRASQQMRAARRYAGDRAR
jgi:hypothetical protein